MLFRRRKCVGQVFLATFSVLLILWMFRESSPDLYQQSLHQDSFVLQFEDAIRDVPNIPPPVPKCLSSAERIQVTANFTTNDILDSMSIEYFSNGIVAHSTMTRKEAVANDIRDLDATPLEIIVIPHSHNDPGWKKTYMQYYQDQTRHILDLIVEKLNYYTDMTFVWVESCFLNTWWTNQTSAKQEQLRRLVKSGRLELVSGMWVAPDEASTHYFALVDQLIEGHYWVNKHFGIIPETSLNFDQFGYSASIPYLMQLSGLKNVLIKRIHRGVKQILGKNKWMGFKWRQFWDPHGYHDIFGQVDTYEWMSISDSCGPDRSVCRGLDFSIMPDLPKPGSPEAERPFTYDSATGSEAENLEDFVQKVVQQFRLKSANYPHRVMILPHGGDFHYAKPKEWDRQYKNLKILMQYINKRKDEFNIHMRFGTFSDYFFELDKQTSKFDINYPVVSGDFFTYTESNEYWTGYFTTRQFDKRLGREVQESLRAAELTVAILFSDKTSSNILASVKKSMLANLVSARRELGIFQHHDAITGTSQEHVAEDYEKRLSSAFTILQEALSSAVEYLMKIDENITSRGHLRPVLVRTEYNKLTELVPINLVAEGIQIILLNSFTQSRQEIISVLVESSDVIVLDENDKTVQFDIISSPGDKVMIAFVVDFPVVGLKVYTVKPSSESFLNQNRATEDRADLPQMIPKRMEHFCENKYVNVTFSMRTGSPELICYKSLDLCTKFEIDWRYYKGMGGAYTMISGGKDVAAYDHLPAVNTVQGKTVCGIESRYYYFSVFHSLHLSNGITARALKSEVLSDLTKYRGFNGDLAMRVSTSIVNRNTFYTDSNGMQLLGRKFRESLPFDANVYPITSMAILEDDMTRLVVHSAQPHGVTSRASGLLDVMIDRVALRPEMDMPESVSDNKLTKTVFYMSFEFKGQFQTSRTRETALPSINSIFLNDILQHPVNLFITSERSAISKKSFSFLPETLSCDVILANVKNLATDDFQSDGISLTLFRRAVSCDPQEDNHFCKVFENTNINPGNLLGKKPGSKASVREMYLSLLEAKRGKVKSSTIDLQPMEVKTFLIN